jgi:hypothetical protein
VGKIVVEVEKDVEKEKIVERALSQAHAETQTEMNEEVEALPTILEVPGPERMVEKQVLVEVIKYIDRPVAQADGSTHLYDICTKKRISRAKYHVYVYHVFGYISCVCVSVCVCV